jgi:glycosyltransferase involved in cell wall biosynthesis
VLFYLNGKFAAQHTTGVQRVASSLCHAIDRRLERERSTTPDQWILLCPPGASVPAFRHIQVRVVGPAGLPLSLWEQSFLPWAARDSMLISLAGSAPLMATQQVCMIHDAAVFDQPEAYTLVFRTWYRILFRSLSRSALLLLTASDFSRRRLVESLGIETEQIRVVPCGGDHLDHVRPDNRLVDRFNLRKGRFLLAVGSANPNKNLAALEAAFRRLPRKRSQRLVIVGGMNRRVFAAPDAQASTESNNVLRIGPVSDECLKALYQHAAGLVFPSLYEGFGLPPLEAMRCGCPVAASSAASIPEVCSQAVLYFDPHSSEEMISAMQELLDNASTGNRLRTHGAAHSKAFAWDRSAAWLIEQLQEVYSRRKAATRSLQADI